MKTFRYVRDVLALLAVSTAICTSVMLVFGYYLGSL